MKVLIVTKENIGAEEVIKLHDKENNRVMYLKTSSPNFIKDALKVVEELKAIGFTVTNKTEITEFIY